MDNLDSIIEILNKKGKISTVEGATAEQIEQFEKDNYVELPVKYKEWLMRSDGGYFFPPAGVQLYGVVHQPSINLAETDKPSDEYVVIGALSFGDPVLFKKGGEQIAVYNHESGMIEQSEVYSDFYDFINKIPDLIGLE